MVEPHHRREVAGIQVGRVALGDQAVGVRRIADDEHLDVAGGVVVQRLALNRKDRRVGFEEFAPFHAWAARSRSDQQGDVGILEGDVRIVGGHDSPKQGKRAVVDLHDDAFEGTHGRRDLEQLQYHRLIGSEHFAGSDPENEGVA